MMPKLLPNLSAEYLKNAPDYEALRQRVEARIDPDPVFFNELHALIVRHGKTFCAAAPACGECGIRSSCLTGSALRAGRRSCGR